MEKPLVGEKRFGDLETPAYKRRGKKSKCCNDDMLPSGQCLNCGADGRQIVSAEDKWEVEERARLQSEWEKERDDWLATQAEKAKLQSLEDAINNIKVD